MRDTAPMRTGRTYTQWFYEGKADALWALFTPDLRGVVRDVRRLEGMRRRLAEEAGPEAVVVRESVREENGSTVYVRVARFGNGQHLRLRWRTDRAGRIAGFLVRAEPAPTRFAEYRTRTRLRLPFDGEWFVVWGGRTREQNRHHVMAADQRFACDLAVLRGGGERHRGDGSAPEQHYCFGRPVLAPAAGTVVTAADGLADQPPGTMDRANPPGNHVILDHGSGEFSVLAHLKRGSVAVRAGERVEPGRKLGECGNSGRSGRPHLHYHLQNTGELWHGEGLPAQFTGYLADGRPVERGEPVRGQTIRPL